MKVHATWIEEDDRWAFGRKSESSVEITKEYLDFLLQEQSLGKRITKDATGLPVATAISSEVDKKASERSWRNGELYRSDIELNKVQDSDPKAIGSVAQWREYRKSLRSWPEHKDFPIKEKRPVAPDA